MLSPEKSTDNRREDDRDENDELRRKGGKASVEEKSVSKI